jgi:preprotein translocase subunit YajC
MDYYVIWKEGDEVQNKSGAIGTVLEVLDVKFVEVDYGLYTKKECIYDLETPE